MDASIRGRRRQIYIPVDTQRNAPRADKVRRNNEFTVHDRDSESYAMDEDKDIEK